MRVITRVSSFLLAAIVPLACTTIDPAHTEGPNSAVTAAYPERIDQFGNLVPMGPGKRNVNSRSPRIGEITFADGPYVIDLADVPAANRPDWTSNLTGPANKRSHAPGPISDEKMAELRERALSLPPQANARQIRAVDIGDVTAGAPAVAPGFDGPDSGDCCGGSGVSVPPDPEMAAGLNHVIAAVNSAFAIYDKSGNEVEAPRTFENFFADLPECQGTFDPNVIYDESADRFFMGIVGNGNGTHYCMAVSQSGDPTLGWNRYSLKVDVDGDFFDFPHAGVGVDAIYFGSNMFASSLTQSIIWAVDKSAMYAGDADPEVNSASVGRNFTPQPMNIHGDTFPASGSPHYFIANVITSSGTWNGEDFSLWKWTDPFGPNAPIEVTGFSLQGISPIAIGFPVNQPQQGGRRSAVLDGGDWRIQDAEYRTDTGYIVMAQAVSCNPGGGTVNCVRWAEIDPKTSSVMDIGMIYSSGEYRSYPDTAVNACGDIAIGYTKTSSSTYPGVWAAARESGGTVDAEFELKAGETTYTSFQSWRQANRWGDYTGMTIDPDGKTFWYLGEYAKDSGYSTNWGTYIAKFTLDSCGGNVNLTPEAVDDSFGLDVQGGSNPSLDGNVLGNDSLGDTPSSASVVTGPSSGSLSLTADGNFTYTPTAGTTGTNSFVYRITDNDGETDTANVIITVTDTGTPNLLPNAVDDSFSIDVATASQVIGNVLTNDNVGDAPANVIFGPPGNGIFTSTTSGGGFYYTPNAGFTGTDSFDYTLTDANGDTSSATVTIDVSDSNNVSIVFISGLSGSGTRTDSRGRWDATVSVTLNVAVAGANVSGSWSGGAKGGGSCTTNGSGQCSITKNRIRSSSATFTIDSVSAIGYTYDPSSNVVSSVDVGPQ